MIPSSLKMFISYVLNKMSHTSKVNKYIQEVDIPFHLPIEKNYNLFYLYKLSRHKTSVFLLSLGSPSQTEE